MRKRIFSILSAVLVLIMSCVLLGGCGQEKTYGGYTKQELEDDIKTTVQALASCSEAEIEQYVAYFESGGDELNANFAQGWLDVSSTQGELVGYRDFTIDQTGKTYTAKMTLVFEQRDAVITAVFKAYNMELESITVEPVYTVSEKMSKAALNTVMGIGIVFSMLAVISLVIKAFELINKAQSGSSKKSVEPEIKPGPIVLPAEADNDELVAVIAAAIAAATGRTTDDFVVRTIKRR